MPDRPRESLRPLWIAWAVLLLLLVLTYVLAYAPLGRYGLPVSIGIAIVKALIILAIFMELTKASNLVRIFASVGFFWLCILLGMPAIDYLSRHDERVSERILDRTVITAPRR